MVMKNQVNVKFLLTVGINSATPFLEVPEEESDQIFSTNSKAIFLTCQVFENTSLRTVLTCPLLMWALCQESFHYHGCSLTR